MMRLSDPAHRKLRLSGAILLLLIVAAVSWRIGAGVTSPADAAARAKPPEPSTVTAAVESKALVRTVVTRGQVTGPHEIPVKARVTGDVDSIVTRQVKRAGDPVHEGDVLVEVAGRPILALEGVVPVYRDMSRGTRGDDVRQLQAALSRLGFYHGRSSAVFDDKTEAAVRKLYSRKGYAPMEAGADPARAQGGLTLPRGEVVFVEQLPGVVSAASATSQPAGGGEALMSVIGGALQIEAFIAPGDRGQLNVGDRAVADSATSHTSIRGTVSEIKDEPGEAGSDGLPREKIVIRPDGPVDPKLLGTDLRVSIDAEATTGQVLSVPISALSGAHDGRAIIIKVGPNGQEIPIPVTPGLNAQGFVAVTTDSHDLHPGDRVVVGR